MTAGQQAGQESGADTAGDGARGDLSAPGLWKRGETCVLDVRVMDPDASSYKGTMDTAKILERAAKQRRAKHREACLERHRSFAPLVCSVDGMAAKEARAFKKRIASLLATKWDRHYSELCGIVRARMSLAVVRNNTLLLRGTRMGKSATFQAEDGAALQGVERLRD